MDREETVRVLVSFLLGYRGRVRPTACRFPSSCTLLMRARGVPYRLHCVCSPLCTNLPIKPHALRYFQPLTWRAAATRHLHSKGIQNCCRLKTNWRRLACRTTPPPSFPHTHTNRHTHAHKHTRACPSTMSSAF
jgi:hypothetical protein